MQKNISWVIPLIVCSFFRLGDATAQNNNSYRFSDPFVHKNLSVVLIHGKDTIKGEKFLTLQEALKKKKAVVHETGNVNQLQITNNSATHNIFIISGTIVKGGKQDRTIQYNYIIPPRTRKMNIASFCVESGRWRKRGDERVSNFNSSEKMIASKDLKMSIKKEKSQSRVWSNVSKIQDKLGNKVGSVKGTKSATSLQLTLEHKKLKKAKKEYWKKLAGIPRGKDEVIGYAFAINGEINSAEIFASHIIFKKLWPKLIEASIIEAISDYDEKARFTQINVKDVKKFISMAEQSKKIAERNVSPRTKVVEKESSGYLMHETRDADNNWINKSYLKK